MKSVWGMAAGLAMVLGGATTAAAQSAGYPVQHAGGFQTSVSGYQPVMPAVYYNSGPEFADPATYYAARLSDHAPAAPGALRGYHALADAGSDHLGCENCGHEGCHSCRGPCLFNPLLLLGCGWRVRGEGVILHRTVAGNVVYAVNDTTGGTALANDNLDFDYEWGFRVAAERRICCDHSIEASYFGQFYWDDIAAATSATNSLQSPYTFGGGPLLGFTDAFLQTLEYQTELQSAELNYWIPLNWHWLGSWKVSTAWGARWVKVSEELTHASFAANGAGVSFIDTDNDLVGGHFGWLVSVPLNCNWQFRWGGRAGIFGNIGRQSTNVVTIDDTGATTFAFSDSARRGDAAFVGGMEAQIAYRLNCGWSIYAGTELLWVEGIALAAEQFTPELTENRINDNGLAYYQGFHFGVEATW